MHWRLALTPPMSGVDNMALDEALLVRARTSGECVVRVYSWQTPTLSFGRNQIARDAYDPNLAASCGVDIVRRPTGGRALLHHHEITYSVTALLVPTNSPRRAYREINHALVDALERIGVRVDVAEAAGPALAPGITPCFDRPSEGELTLNGRKLVGSALYREGNAVLQHGSILVDDDQQLIASCARVAVAPIPPAATLREVIDNPTAEQFADALFSVVRERWDFHAEPLHDDDEVFERAADLRTRYEDREWTWRR